MGALSKFLIGAVSVFFLLLGIAGILLSGLFASMIQGVGALSSLMAFMPFILICLSVLGFWSVIKDVRPAQYTVAIFVLLGWPAGTVVGAIIIATLLLSEGKASKSAA